MSEFAKHSDNGVPLASAQQTACSLLKFANFTCISDTLGGGDDVLKLSLTSANVLLGARIKTPERIKIIIQNQNSSRQVQRLENLLTN